MRSGVQGRAGIPECTISISALNPRMVNGSFYFITISCLSPYALFLLSRLGNFNWSRNEIFNNEFYNSFQVSGGLNEWMEDIALLLRNVKFPSGNEITFINLLMHLAVSIPQGESSGN